MAAAISLEALRDTQYFCTGWQHGKGRLVNKVGVRILKDHHHAAGFRRGARAKAAVTVRVKRLPDFLGKC
jgi:hypothetical protein